MRSSLYCAFAKYTHQNLRPFCCWSDLKNCTSSQVPRKAPTKKETIQKIAAESHVSFSKRALENDTTWPTLRSKQFQRENIGTTDIYVCDVVLEGACVCEGAGGINSNRFKRVSERPLGYRESNAPTQRSKQFQRGKPATTQLHIYI